MAIHSFVSDGSVFDPNITLLNLETTTIPCGYLDREMIEHMVQPIEFTDTRTQRLPIVYRQSFHNNDDTTIGNLMIPDIIDSYGNIADPFTVTMMQYDSLTDAVTAWSYATLYDDVNDVHPKMVYDNTTLVGMANETLLSTPVVITSNRKYNLTFDHTKLEASEITLIESLTEQDKEYLFNIIEYLNYGTIPDDTLVDIDNVLTSDVSFTGYVASSIDISNTCDILHVHDDVNLHRHVPSWGTFSFDKGGEILELTAWFGRAPFRNDYPLFTVLSVVPPLPLETLLDPSHLSDPFDSAILSRSTANNILVPGLTTDDQSGMQTFTTLHVFDNQSRYLTFNIMYRGRELNFIEARQVIINLLIDSGLGSLPVWKSRFPELFVVNQYYLIPLYDDITQLTNTDIHPSITDYINLKTKVDIVTSELVLNSTLEMMTVAYDKYIIGVVGLAHNDGTSLREAHSTYRDFSTTDPGFNEMNTIDRGWSIHLNQAFAIAAGETNNTIYGELTEGGRNFISVMTNKNAYHVITKASYLEALL